MKQTDWIETYTGKLFYPLEPDIELIDIIDIAHALSMICRFNGHSDRFYSVAQHSVIVSNLATPKNKLIGLLHDASEAYLTDVPRPLKPFLPDYYVWEDVLTDMIFTKFGIPDTDPENRIPNEIHIIDNDIVLTEGSALGFDISKWELTSQIGIQPLDVEIQPESSEMSEIKFLEAFYNLTFNIK